MKAYWGMEVQLHAYLTSAMRKDEQCQKSFKKVGLQFKLRLSKPRMGAGEGEVYLHSFPILVLDGGEWVNLRPGPFNPGTEPILLLNWRLDVTHSRPEHSREVKISTNL
jgi:hypothetical protein